LLQAIDAVAEAHSVGIVHRDLKPTNLFLALRPDGARIIKVLDFGISKSLGSGRAREVALTKTAAFVGSPLFMSPEQMRSAKDVDVRADIWALGAILYVMVTGQVPHPGASLPQVCQAVLNDLPRPLTDFLPDAPDRLEAILLKCMAKDRTHRYASVAELAEQLLPFAPNCYSLVERAHRLLGGMPMEGSISAADRWTPAPASNTLPLTLRTSRAEPEARHPPPSATEAPWSKTGRKALGKRRIPILVAGVLSLAVIFAWFRAGISEKAAPTPALSPGKTAPGSAPGASATLNVTLPEAPPGSNKAPAALPEGESNDAAIGEGPALPASAGAPRRPKLPATKPPAMETAVPSPTPTPNAPGYTYFGGRR
jgi:serine/threonine protein kinase